MMLVEIWFVEGMEKGVQQGIKEGKYQVLVQVVEVMCSCGIDDQVIMEMIGLFEDELQWFCY